MKKVIVLVLLLCSAVLAQKTYPPPGLSPTTFANLGTPANGAAFYCSDCAATAPCTGSGTGANAYRVAGAWNCNTGAAGGTPGGSPGQVQFNDTTFGGDATLTFDKTTKILSASQLLAASRSTTGSIVHTGAGLSDLSKSGIFTGITGIVYTITIDAADVPDTFHWDDGAGGNVQDGVAITGAAQLLSNGVSITFAATTGHTLADSWTFTTTATAGIVVKDAAGIPKTFLNGDDNFLSGDLILGTTRGATTNGAAHIIATYIQDDDNNGNGAVMISAQNVADPTANGKGYLLADVYINSADGNSHDINNLSTATFDSKHLGSGTVGVARAGFFDAANVGAGTITNSQSLVALPSRNGGSGTIEHGVALLIPGPSNGGGGSVVENVGVEIEDQSPVGSSKAYNIWSKGTTGLNVFEGIIRNGTLTASQAVFTDASKNLISVATTGSGSAVLATSPALTGTPTVNGLSIATVGNVGSVLSVLSSNATLATATGTTYSSPGYGGTPMAATSEATVGWVCPRAGTIGTLYMITGSVAKVNTPVTTVTIRKNGADTTVTLTLTQTTSTVSSDLTHSFTVAAGDTITLSFATTGVAAVSTSIAGVSFLLN